MKRVYRRFQSPYEWIEDSKDGLLSLQQLLAELSLKVDRMPLTRKQRFFFESWNLPLVELQILELREIITNPRAQLKEHSEVSFGGYFPYLGDTVEPLVEHQQALLSNLLELSQKVKQLAIITQDSSLEAFYERLIGLIITMLSTEDSLVSTLLLLSDKNRGGGGSNGNNGSGNCGGGFPSGNPKLISSNRSMPWYQPQYFN